MNDLENAKEAQALIKQHFNVDVSLESVVLTLPKSLDAELKETIENWLDSAYMFMAVKLKNHQYQFDTEWALELLE